VEQFQPTLFYGGKHIQLVTTCEKGHTYMQLVSV